MPIFTSTATITTCGDNFVEAKVLKSSSRTQLLRQLYALKAQYKRKGLMMNYSVPVPIAGAGPCPIPTSNGPVRYNVAYGYVGSPCTVPRATMVLDPTFCQSCGASIDKYGCTRCD